VEPTKWALRAPKSNEQMVQSFFPDAPSVSQLNLVTYELESES
jgi:hypothetical protein